MNRLRRLLRDCAGATMVETALVLPLLLILSFGVLEFGLGLWQYNSAEKATAAAARYVATRGPLLINTNECFDDGVGAVAGTRCSEVDNGNAWSATWTGTTCSGNCDPAVMAAVVARVQAIASFVPAQNIQVEARETDFGFVGRGAPVPLYTVRLVNQNFNFIALNGLLGLGPIAMPGFDATSVGEDQNEGEWNP